MDSYLVALLAVGWGVLLLLAAGAARRLLAPRAPSPAKSSTYESGVDPVDPTGRRWSRVSSRYLTFALLSTVFAVDAALLLPWALVLHGSLGVRSAVEMAVFVGVVLVGLAHAHRHGLLRWS